MPGLLMRPFLTVWSALEIPERVWVLPLSLAFNQIFHAWSRNYLTSLEAEALSVRVSPQPLNWLVIGVPIKNEALMV